MNATAFVTTDRAPRYIKQLMSHFSHRITTSVDDDGIGRAEFPAGSCVLTPREGGIEMMATAEDAESLARVKDVVGGHLERFGAKDNLTVTWKD